MTIDSLIIGIVIGNVSTVTTLILFHFIVSPRVSFSKRIRLARAKIRNAPSYSIRMEKKGWIDLIDTTIRCRIAIKDIHKRGSDLWTFYNVPTSFSDSLRVKIGMRIIHLWLHKAKAANSGAGPIKRYVEIKDIDSGLRFEDIFLAYQDVHIMIFVIGHDRFTGIKKLYVSNKYYLHSIQHGEWDGLELIKS